MIEDRYPHEIALYNLPVDCGGLTMLELGNKRTTIDKAKGVRVVWKDYFSEKGFIHTSVDWNGKDGALKKDLRRPLNLGTFDYVTNIGTSEHVSEQKPVWENIVSALSVGSVLVCTTPLPGDWHWHGEWYPKEGFYDRLAEMNGLAFEEKRIFNDAPRRMIGVRMIREADAEFQMPPADLIYRNR